MIVSHHDVHLSRIMVTIVSVFISVTIPRVRRMTIVLETVSLHFYQIILLVFEVSTISNIIDCHQRHCGYVISDLRWFADNVIRLSVIHVKYNAN